jgi:hypothetical protein
MNQTKMRTKPAGTPWKIIGILHDQFDWMYRHPKAVMPMQG